MSLQKDTQNEENSPSTVLFVPIQFPPTNKDVALKLLESRFAGKRFFDSAEFYMKKRRNNDSEPPLPPKLYQ